MQASQIEKDGAIALLNKAKNVKAKVHYDPTTRSSLKGEWPSITLKFSNGFEYRLRPLF